MLIVRAGLAAAILVLSGCAKEPGPLDQDLVMGGAEPFWAATVSNQTKMMKFSRIGSADMDAGYPVESKAKDAIVLTSQSPEGDIVITLHKKACQDGLSERKYPWIATVKFKGRTLAGCAGPKLPPVG